MSATTILAKQLETGRILHIDDVNKRPLSKYSCVDCQMDLIVVKSEALKKEPHFRHPEGKICSGPGNRALHDFAVQILMESSTLIISESKKLNYTNPKAEVGFLDFRSDVAIDCEGEVIHTEVFVTNDLTPVKINAYIDNNIKCVRIDLSNPELLTANKEKIIEQVLNSWENKSLIGWETKSISVANTSQSWKVEDVFKAIFGVAIFILSVYLVESFVSFLFKPRYRRA